MRLSEAEKEWKKHEEVRDYLTKDRINNMDLCEIEKYIEEKIGPLRHDPRIYRRCRDPFAAMGRFLTKEEHENTIKTLCKKYGVKYIPNPSVH